MFPIALLMLLVLLLYTPMGSGAGAGFLGGALLFLAVYVALKVMPPLIAGWVPADTVAVVPWMAPALQWATGICLLLLGVHGALWSYRKSTGI